MLFYLHCLITNHNKHWYDILLNHTLYSLVATNRNILTILGCWILSWIIGRMIINKDILKKYKEHWMYGVKLCSCSIAVWMPGLRPGLKDGHNEIAEGTGIDGEEIGYRIVLGIILAGVAIIIPIIIKWLSTKYLPDKLAKDINKIIF